MARKRDYYEVLSVSPNADADEIKRAYRGLARQYHPDVNNGTPEAEERFKEINAAYEILSDPDKRAIYDRYGHEGLEARGVRPTGDPFGFSDILSDLGFGSIFDSFFGGGGTAAGRRTRQRTQGEDLRADVEVTLEEVVFGADRQVTFQRMDVCGECVGTGSADGSAPRQCPHCKGSGQVRRVQSTIMGTLSTVTTCNVCRGEGQVNPNPCKRCRGEARVEAHVTREVRVPPGVEDGVRLRVPYEGNIGRRNGERGDLYVFIRVLPHEVFERRGRDIASMLEVSFTQAALGTQVEVRTLEGTELLRVPPGTQPGTVLKLREQGLPGLSGGVRGDHHIVISVRTPTKLTARERELLRRFAEERGEPIVEGKGIVDKLKDAIGG
jgi:molecular chaperone DnaJ